MILAIVFSIEFFFLAQTFFVFKRSDFLASVLPSALIELTNEDRKADSVPKLEINSKLQAAAQLKANDMATKGYFSHISPDGITPWYWFEKAGYSFSYAGENLAVNFFDSNDVNSAWMNSIAHKENIMNAKFKEIGVGTAKGIYKGQESIFIVQLFASPARSPASRKASKPVAIINKNENKTQASAGTVPVSESILSEKNKIKEPDSNPKVESYSVQATPVSEINSMPVKLSSIKRLSSMPRLTTNYVFIFLLAIVFLALVLKIMIKIRIQYPRLILNGFFLLTIISLAIFFNKYIDVVNAAIY